MKYEIGKQYEIVGKVEGVNQGTTFYNTTVGQTDGTSINIKLREGIDKVIIGKIYSFKVECEEKPDREDEQILSAVEITPAEEVFSHEKTAELFKTFYEYAPTTPKELRKGIEGYLKQIKNPVLHKITSKIYKENKERFYVHPAATKFHHAYIGGLAFHTLNMLRAAEHYLDIYPYLSKDLLYAGTILHDVSKTEEMTGVDGEYTKEGLLMGHIVLGTLKIDQAARELGYEKEEETLLLKHMMLSHHGQLNYGSPKRPQLAEAYLLWFIDTIDSKFQVIGEVLNETVDGTFTSSIPVADKSRFLKHKLTNKK